MKGWSGRRGTVTAFTALGDADKGSKTALSPPLLLRLTITKLAGRAGWFVALTRVCRGSRAGGLSGAPAKPLAEEGQEPGWKRGAAGALHPPPGERQMEGSVPCTPRGCDGEHCRRPSPGFRPAFAACAAWASRSFLGAHSCNGG